MVYYGQVVIGPPGCGKSTYCHGMHQFMSQMGREVAVVNLDFANERIRKLHFDADGQVTANMQDDDNAQEEGEGYDCVLDVRELVSLEKVMEEYSLGPNGGMMMCMETLLENVEWLIDRLRKLPIQYVIFDCPGQVELFSHHTALSQILTQLQKQLDFRLASVHLIDSFYCCEPATFISAVTLVANTMMRLALPHINVLTKVDLLPRYGPLPFTLNFYTEMTSLKPLVEYIDNPVRTLKDIEKEEKEQGFGSADLNLNEEDGGDDDDMYRDHGSYDSDDEYRVPARRPGRGSSRMARMAWNLCDVLDDFGLVNFLPCNVSDATTIGRILIHIDKANGFVYAAHSALVERQRQQQQQQQRQGGGSEAEDVRQEQQELASLFNMASQDLESTYEKSLEIYERYNSTATATVGALGGEQG